MPTHPSVYILSVYAKLNRIIEIFLFAPLQIQVIHRTIYVPKSATENTQLVVIL